MERKPGLESFTSASPKQQASLLWRCLCGCFWGVILFAIVFGSYAGGMAVTLVVIEIAKDRGDWPTAIGVKQATEVGGMLFGLLPAYIILDFIGSRRQNRKERRGFDLEHPGKQGFGQMYLNLGGPRPCTSSFRFRCLPSRLWARVTTPPPARLTAASGTVPPPSTGDTSKEQTVNPDGVYKFWHENGVLAKEFTLVNGRVEGLIRMWHDNGVLAKEVTYVDDQVHGTVRQWNREGKLLGEYTMARGWGVERVWNEDGSLYMESECLMKDPIAMRATVYDYRGQPHEAFVWNSKSISEKKFYKRLARALGEEIKVRSSCVL